MLRTFDARRTRPVLLGTASVICALALLGSLALPRRAQAGAPGRLRIVASVGPTSGTVEVLQRLLVQGADLFRFNLAHKDRRISLRETQAARAAVARVGRQDVALLFDLPGGKLRTGPAPAGGELTLREGDAFALTFGGRAGATTRDGASVDYARLDRYAQVGGRVLLHQGKLELEITAVAPGRIETRVVRGGVLRGHATVNLVGQDPRFPAMTAQDRRKLKIAVECGADLVGVSMVQTPSQMRAVRRALVRLGAPRVRLVSKIETLSALEHLEAIVDESDLAMIARGDLATAVGTKEALTAAERRIAEVCRRKGKAFFDATGFEGPDAAAEVARARALGSSYIILKNTAIDADPASLVSRLRALLTRK